MILERRGLSVSLQKLDPYINVDPGTMSPFQHGEVYVTADGAETDLDLGHYERFTKAVRHQPPAATTRRGKIYNCRSSSRERRGDYLGRVHPGRPARHERDQAVRSTPASRPRRHRMW